MKNDIQKLMAYINTEFLPEHKDYYAVLEGEQIYLFRLINKYNCDILYTSEVSNVIKFAEIYRITSCIMIRDGKPCINFYTF